jgi:hypothetical protein
MLLQASSHETETNHSELQPALAACPVYLPATGHVLELRCADTTAIATYRVSQEECARLREGVPYGKVYRYNPKHICQKLNGYGDNGQRKVWSTCGFTHFTYQLTSLINVCP